MENCKMVKATKGWTKEDLLISNKAAQYACVKFNQVRNHCLFGFIKAVNFDFDINCNKPVMIKVVNTGRLVRLSMYSYNNIK